MVRASLDIYLPLQVVLGSHLIAAGKVNCRYSLISASGPRREVGGKVLRDFLSSFLKDH